MKIKKFLLILLLPFLFLIGGCSTQLDKISKDLNTYTMDITYNDNYTFTVKQKLDYRHTHKESVENLMLHLYPRSFREGASSSVVSTLNYSKCYYNGVTFGDIEIHKIDVNDCEQDIIISGSDEDILVINFDKPLSNNDRKEIYIEYTITLPNINHRFGYGENTINVANFYPIACVYENGNYVTDSYHYNGDPFYSEVANYNVTLNLPDKYKVASTGNIIAQATHENIVSYNIQAHVVRDFAFVLSDNFNIITDNTGDTIVNYYYYSDKSPTDSLQAGVDAVNTFTKLFGEYPYDTLNIAETNFVHGGMEYPNLVLISDEVDIESDYINVIVHEVAHQWWYGVIGNNEYDYGWLDEGLTEYSTLLFYEENPKYNVDTKELIKNTTNSYVTFVDIYNKVFSKVDTSMNRKLNEYNNESEYVYIAYVKGMLLFDNIRELLGTEKFLKCLQTYYNDHKFQIATPEKMLTSFEKASGQSLLEVFNSWINGKVQIFQIN